MGPNGAGKSTLIKALAGLIHPDAGNILWNGNPLHDMPREIAYLPQRSDVDWSFPITVRALVEMAATRPWACGKNSPGTTGRLWKSPCTCSVWSTWRNARFPSFPAASSSGPSWRAPWRRKRTSSCWTNRSRAWTPPLGQSLGRLLDSLAGEGRLVIASHHDLNTAAEIFDTVLLMNRDLVAFGPAQEVLSPERIRETYGMNA